MLHRLLLGLCLILGISAPSLGQVYLGPVVGYSWSGTSIERGDQELEIQDDGTGPLFGGFIGYRLAHILSLESGVNYATQSVTVELGGAGVKLEESYLNVPVILMLEFPSQFIVKARVRGGAQFGFGMSCKTKTIVSGETTNEEDCAEGDTPTKSPDIGAPLSVGLGVGLGEALYVFLDVGAKIGLTNVADTSKPGAEDLSIKHNSVFAMAGLSIGLGG